LLGCQGLLRCDRGSNRLGTGLEDAEEGISFRADLDSTVAFDGLTHEPIVGVLQRFVIPAEPLQ
jgi:hypothetical protein